jgi:hypothetical protein
LIEGAGSRPSIIARGGLAEWKRAWRTRKRLDPEAARWRLALPVLEEG